MFAVLYERLQFIPLANQGVDISVACFFINVAAFEIQTGVFVLVHLFNNT